MSKTQLLKQMIWILAIIAIALVSWIFARPFIDEIKHTAKITRYFDSMNVIGDHCTAVIEQPPTPSDMASLWVTPKNPKPMLIPFRRDPKYTLPPEGSYSYTRCTFTLMPATNQALQRFLILGRIFGQAEVRVNGTLLWTQSSTKFPIIGIPTTVPSGESVLEILAMDGKHEGFSGPATALPIIATNNVEDVQLLNFMMMYYDKSSKGLARLGVAFAFSLLFFICYWRGLRYPDVMSALIAFAAYGISAGASYTLNGPVSPSFSMLADYAGWVSSIASCALIYTFLRLPASPAKVFSLSGAAVFIYGVVKFLPVETRLFLGFGNGRNALYFALFYGFVLVQLWRENLAAIPERKRLQRRIVAGIITLATASFLVTVFGAFHYSIDFTPLVKFLVLVMYGLILSVDLVMYHRGYFEEKSLKEQEQVKRREVEVEAMRNSAIAQTTQMLAHDVRRPFSLLQVSLQMLSEVANDPASVTSMLSRIIPEIDRATRNVDGLISDVMEIGSTASQLVTEPISPVAITLSSLLELCGSNPKADFSISYDFRHSHLVLAHQLKISRVFGNILSNAVQAVRNKGELWFKTRELDGFVEFCVGNRGSYIAPENIEKIFDAFFTSGKKTGTGLGLAIAQKVIAAHGGSIWCVSEKSLEFPDGKVEFFFTLPIATELANPGEVKSPLPKDSAEIARTLLSSKVPSTLKLATADDEIELALERDINQEISHLGLTFSILVVDDEATHRNGLIASISRSELIRDQITFIQADSSHGAHAAMATAKLDLVICDVDLGTNSDDGFTLVTALRTKFSFIGMTCIHTNRCNASDYRAAIDCGADALLPKPMTRTQLLKLVLQGVIHARRTAAKA